jgi:hypothetical protein
MWALCGHCVGTVWALCGHCVGTVKAQWTQSESIVWALVRCGVAVHSQYHCTSKLWPPATGLDTTAFAHLALGSFTDVSQMRGRDLLFGPLCCRPRVDLDRRQAILLLLVDEIELGQRQVGRHAVRESPTSKTADKLDLI